MSQARDPLPNKRSFFRIDVMVPFSYRVIPAEEADLHPLPDDPDEEFIETHFLNNLHQIDQSLQQAIEELSSVDNRLAAALLALNSKINMSFKVVDKTRLTRLLPQVRINLSGSGLAFDTHQPVRPGDKIDLLLQPLPYEAPIITRSRVVGIRPPEDPSYPQRVAVAYENISEEDRRKLLFFIHQKELEEAHEQGRSPIPHD